MRALVSIERASGDEGKQNKKDECKQQQFQKQGYVMHETFCDKHNSKPTNWTYE